MQFAYLAAAAALVASVAAGVSNGTVSAVWVTETATAYTTYCPAATTFTYGPSTYIATAVVTIPCADSCYTSKLVTVTPVVSCNSCTAKPYSNSTAPLKTGAPTPTTTKAVTFGNGGNRAVAGSAAGLAGLLGLAAYIL